MERAPEIEGLVQKMHEAFEGLGLPLNFLVHNFPSLFGSGVVNSCPDFSMSLNLHCLFTIAIVAALVEIDNDIVVYLMGLTVDEFEAGVFLSL
jgi:hypothetical protein